MDISHCLGWSPAPCMYKRTRAREKKREKKILRASKGEHNGERMPLCGSRDETACHTRSQTATSAGVAHVKNTCMHLHLMKQKKQSTLGHDRNGSVEA